MYFHFENKYVVANIFISILSKIKLRLLFNGFNIFRNKNFVCITITCYIYKFILIILEFTKVSFFIYIKLVICSHRNFG